MDPKIAARMIAVLALGAAMTAAFNRRRFLGSSRPATPYVAPSIENDQSRPLPSGAKNQSHPGALAP